MILFIYVLLLVYHALIIEIKGASIQKTRQKENFISLSKNGVSERTVPFEGQRKANFPPLPAPWRKRRYMVYPQTTPGKCFRDYLNFLDKCIRTRLRRLAKSEDTKLEVDLDKNEVSIRGKQPKNSVHVMRVIEESGLVVDIPKALLKKPSSGRYNEEGNFLFVNPDINSDREHLGVSEVTGDIFINNTKQLARDNGLRSPQFHHINSITNSNKKIYISHKLNTDNQKIPLHLHTAFEPKQKSKVKTFSCKTNNSNVISLINKEPQISFYSNYDSEKQESHSNQPRKGITDRQNSREKKSEKYVSKETPFAEYGFQNKPLRKNIKKLRIPLSSLCEAYKKDRNSTKTLRMIPTTGNMEDDSVEKILGCYHTSSSEPTNDCCIDYDSEESDDANDSNSIGCTSESNCSVQIINATCICYIDSQKICSTVLPKTKVNCVSSMNPESLGSTLVSNINHDSTSSNAHKTTSNSTSENTQTTPAVLSTNETSSKGTTQIGVVSSSKAISSTLSTNETLSSTVTPNAATNFKTNKAIAKLETTNVGTSTMSIVPTNGTDLRTALTNLNISTTTTMPTNDTGLKTAKADKKIDTTTAIPTTLPGLAISSTSNKMPSMSITASLPGSPASEVSSTLGSSIIEDQTLGSTSVTPATNGGNKESSTSITTMAVGTSAASTNSTITGSNSSTTLASSTTDNSSTNSFSTIASNSYSTVTTASVTENNSTSTRSCTCPSNTSATNILCTLKQIRSTIRCECESNSSPCVTPEICIDDETLTTECNDLITRPTLRVIFNNAGTNLKLVKPYGANLGGLKYTLTVYKPTRRPNRQRKCQSRRKQLRQMNRNHLNMRGSALRGSCINTSERTTNSLWDNDYDYAQSNDDSILEETTGLTKTAETLEMKIINIENRTLETIGKNKRKNQPKFNKNDILENRLVWPKRYVNRSSRRPVMIQAPFIESAKKKNAYLKKLEYENKMVTKETPENEHELLEENQLDKKFHTPYNSCFATYSTNTSNKATKSQEKNRILQLLTQRMLHERFNRTKKLDGKDIQDKDKKVFWASMHPENGTNLIVFYVVNQNVTELPREIDLKIQPDESIYNQVK